MNFWNPCPGFLRKKLPYLFELLESGHVLHGFPRKKGNKNLPYLFDPQGKENHKYISTMTPSLLLLQPCALFGFFK